AVLVRARAGGPLAADVHADAHAVLHAGAHAPVPERAMGPHAAAPVLDRVTAVRLERVAPLADPDEAPARQRVVLRVELEARRRPRHHDVEALLAGRLPDPEGGLDLAAAARRAAERDAQARRLDGVLVLDGAPAPGDRALDVLGHGDAPGPAQP